MAKAVHGQNAVAVPEDMELVLLETARSAAGDFEQFVRLLGEAQTRTVLTETMTAEDGSSESQARVHETLLTRVVARDARNRRRGLGRACRADETGTIAAPSITETEGELRAWVEQDTSRIGLAIRRFFEGPSHTIVKTGWYLKLDDVHHDAADFLALLFPFQAEIPIELPESLRGVEPTPHRVARLPAGAIA